MIPVSTPKTGFVIPYGKLFDFTGNYVRKLGLTNLEADEFIRFWKPKLPVSPYYLVSHLDPKTINSIYPLTISPEPDTLLRVEIYFKPLSLYAVVTPPEMPSIAPRTGFTAVEWGGIMDIYK
jgi:hypothetical protein